VARPKLAPGEVPIIPLETLPPGVHPGYVLDKYIHDARLNQKLAAELMGMTRHTVNLIVREKQGVSLPTAVRLATLFTQTTVAYWRQLQDRYELHRRQALKQRVLKVVVAAVALRVVVCLAFEGRPVEAAPAHPPGCSRVAGCTCGPAAQHRHALARHQLEGF
jgi:addiction module HigA family antidote